MNWSQFFLPFTLAAISLANIIINNKKYIERGREWMREREDEYKILLSLVLSIQFPILLSGINQHYSIRVYSFISLTLSLFGINWIQLHWWIINETIPYYSFVYIGFTISFLLSNFSFSFWFRIWLATELQYSLTN